MHHSLFHSHTYQSSDRLPSLIRTQNKIGQAMEPSMPQWEISGFTSFPSNGEHLHFTYSKFHISIHTAIILRTSATLILWNSFQRNTQVVSCLFAPGLHSHLFANCLSAEKRRSQICICHLFTETHTPGCSVISGSLT